MRCPKQKRHCSPKIIHRAGKDFICSGITSKPTKWKKDNVKLCLKGTLSGGGYRDDSWGSCFNSPKPSKYACMTYPQDNDLNLGDTGHP